MNDDFIIRCATEKDIPAVRDIYNAGIASGLGTFETSMRSDDDIGVWLKTSAQYPLLVADEDGTVTGFARLYEYRPRECYKGIAEFSIYLAGSAQGKGMGLQLLTALLNSAKTHGFHKVLSRIFTFNQASRALCRKLGFREVGIYERHGELNGKWLDVVIVEYLV